MTALRFGTDGVRGRAGVHPVDAVGARRLGRALAALSGGGLVLVGEDTRESSPGLADALAAGVRAGGALAGRLGVLPTPALSCAVPAFGAAFGAMITASHNLWQDNGMKVLGPDGAKVPDEAALEAALEAAEHLPDLPGGRIRRLPEGIRPWKEALPQVDLRGLRVLFDGANGAASALGPPILTALGATVTRRGCAPDGRNINAGCGALHPPAALDGADVAICLDGDGDRLAMVAPGRGALDGDDLLWLLAHADPARRPVVGTTMTNGGLEAALEGRLVRVGVGDRNVALGMGATGAVIGGEPSGHILFSDGPPSSCGLFTALRVLALGWPPVLGWTRWPQARRDVATRRPLDILRTPGEAERAGCRVLVRCSGTEPLVRVMVEGPDPHTWADRIAAELAP